MAYDIGAWEFTTGATTVTVTASLNALLKKTVAKTASLDARLRAPIFKRCGT